MPCPTILYVLIVQWPNGLSSCRGQVGRDEAVAVQWPSERERDQECLKSVRLSAGH